jgi:hypothetical protein
VLISPIGIGQPDWSEKIFPVAITRDQVKNSPDIDTEKPVSRQAGRQGNGSIADSRSAQASKAELGDSSDAARNQHDDPHLRSGNSIMRYYVHATDGDIGHVQGLLVDEKSWAIRYLIVNTSNWWLGRQVIVAPQWIDHVSWAESTVFADLTRQIIKSSPSYDAAASLNREEEAGIHVHYGRAAYSPRDARRVRTN